MHEYKTADHQKERDDNADAAVDDSRVRSNVRVYAEKTGSNIPWNLFTQVMLCQQWRKKNADKGTEISHLNELLGQQSKSLSKK